MSNSLAIATVTESMRYMIHGALDGSGVDGAHVTTLRPDAPSGLPNPGVNIFLYRVTPNTAGQNVDLPTRRADGSLIRQPQAALDLHYLLTFYGDDTTLDTQRLMGATILELHSVPVLSRDLIRHVQNQFAWLNSSNLADQIDLVRVRPANLNLDETNKLWMTFPNVDYVLSVAYIAGVVLIASDDPPPASALPVVRWRVKAVPFSLASIDSIEPQPVDLSPMAPNQITLFGSNLDPSDDVMFSTPGQTNPIPGIVQSGMGGQQLVVTLPTGPSGLRPGVNTVQLTQPETAPSSSSDLPRAIAQSNVAAFVVRPTIVSKTYGSPPGQLVIVLSTPVGPRQQVSLLLNELGSSAPKAYAVPASPRLTPTDTLQFDLSGISTGSIPPELFGGQGGSIPPGTYLVRVRVDGAESLLETDNVSGSFNGPIVTI